MKRIICIVFVSLTFFSCTQKEETKIQVDASLGIIKTEKSYEIYSNKGVLILEFTKQNCDSSSLETLEYIYQVSKEFYNRDPSKEKEIQSIKHSEI